MNDDIVTIAEASQRIRARQVSPVELTAECLDRIDALDSQLHTYVLVRVEAALAEAKEAEAEIRRGDWRGPLHGMPIGLKDIIETAGIRTAGQSRLCLDHVPQRSAVVHQRLQRAGAILLGKHTTHEFALGGPDFELPFPPARNPWDPTRFTGGSSSGSAAAVASGMCLGAFGTDTGGSVRGPAALCGVAGLKTTLGRIDMSGIFPLAPTQDTCGPLAWTAADCGLLLQAVADGMVELPAPGARVRGLRLGIPERWLDDEWPPGPEAAGALHQALTVFDSLGVACEAVPVPSLEAFHACGMVIALREAFAEFGDYLTQRTSAFGVSFRDPVLLGAAVGDASYERARHLRRQLLAELNATLQRFDALVLPTNDEPAPPIAGVETFGILRSLSYMMPANVAGVPALSLCCGYSSDGLPLGLQLIGRANDEATLIRLGQAYEAACAWRARRPDPPATAG